MSDTTCCDICGGEISLDDANYVEDNHGNELTECNDCKDSRDCADVEYEHSSERCYQ